MRRVRMRLLPKQLNFLTSTEREVHFEAGIGSGKTKILCTKAIKTFNDFPGLPWILGSKDYPQLLKVVIPEFKSQLKVFGYQEGVDYFYKESPYPKFTIGESRFDCVSGEAYESSLRAGNYAGAFFDEVEFIREMAWNNLKGRIRVWPERLNTASSPNGFNFIYKDFHLNPKPYRKLIKMTSYENTFLSKEYLQSLEDTYSPRLLEQEVMAKRMAMTGEPAYLDFNPDYHVQDIHSMMRNFSELHWVTDYNIAKYCGIICAYSNKTLWVFDEIATRYKGSDFTSRAVMTRYPRKTFLAIGDSTGNEAKDVRAKQTNYQIFRANGMLTVPFRNPSVVARVISVNSNFSHGRIIIDKRCKELIKDLGLVKYKDESAEIDKTDPERSHMSDALGYADWYFQGVGKRKVAKTTQRTAK